MKENVAFTPSYFNYRFSEAIVPYFITIVQAKMYLVTMQVSKPPYQDPTTNAANWLAIDFESVKTFETPISLGQIKAEPTLQDIGLIKQPRLSVVRLSKNEFAMSEEGYEAFELR